MGRSQETFGKKEREKKKQKKKELKAKRKQERQEMGGDNSGDNLTYQDVYGNFHDTPPEKAEKVNAESVNLGAAPREDQGDYDPVRKGMVTFFNHDKGYGFIRDKATQESIFVHVKNTEEEINEDNAVTFEVEQGPKGLSAFNVKVTR